MKRRDIVDGIIEGGPVRALALSCILIAIAAAPAWAGTRLCNATLASATCGSVCSTSGDGLLYFSLSRTDPDGGGPLVSLSTEVGDALCWKFNYQPTVAGGAPNQESCPAFGERMVRETFRETLRAYRDYQAELAKQAALAANPVPEIP